MIARAACACLLSAAVGLAAEAASTVDAAAYSQYLWRGRPLNDEAVLQPGYTYGFEGGVSLNLWGSVNLTDVSGRALDVGELDLTADWGFAIGEAASVSLGGIYYTFPSGEDETWEVYATLDFDIPASPSVAVYYDGDAAKGVYVAVSVGHEFEWGLSLGASVGAGDPNMNDWTGVADDEGGLGDLTLTADYSFDLGDAGTLGLGVVFAMVLNADQRDALKSEADQAAGGVTYSVEF